MTPPAKTTNKKTPARKKAAAKKPGTDLVVAGAKVQGLVAPEGKDLAALVKLAGNSLVDPTRPTDLTWYATGSTAFDEATANGHDIIGGFPGGRIVEMYGNESSGKTTLALQAAVRIQQQGKVVVYIDYERSFHEGYAQSLGLDTTDFLKDGGLFWLVEPEFMEEGFTLLDGLCEHPATKDIIGMFIIDSVAAQQSMHSKDAKDEHDRLGLVAAQMSRFLPPFTRKLKQTKAVAIFINQTRQNPSAGPFGDPVSTPGGKALKFYASMRIALARGFKIKSTMLDPFTGKREQTAIGHWVKVVIKKNKVSGEFYNAVDVPIVDNLGVDNLLSCVFIGKALGMIEGSGHMTIPAHVAGSQDDIKAQGPYALRSALALNQQVADTFVATVQGAVRANFAIVQKARLAGNLINNAESNKDIDAAIEDEADIIDVQAVEVDGS